MSGHGKKPLPCDNLYLSGMMGAGKSAVARLLAQKLERDFADCDADITRMAGKSIAEIFEEDGEAAFRYLETQALRTLASRENLVVALGGGAVVREENRELLSQSGTTIFLAASVETLLLRLNFDPESRPLLAHLSKDGKRQKLISLLANRREAYESADFTVHTDGMSTDEVLCDILPLIDR